MEERTFIYLASTTLPIELAKISQVKPLYSMKLSNSSLTRPHLNLRPAWALPLSSRKIPNPACQEISTPKPPFKLSNSLLAKLYQAFYQRKSHYQNSWLAETCASKNLRSTTRNHKSTNTTENQAIHKFLLQVQGKFQRLKFNLGVEIVLRRFCRPILKGGHDL